MTCDDEHATVSQLGLVYRVAVGPVSLSSLYRVTNDASADPENVVWWRTRRRPPQFEPRAGEMVSESVSCGSCRFRNMHFGPSYHWAARQVDQKHNSRDASNPISSQQSLSGPSVSAYGPTTRNALSRVSAAFVPTTGQLQCS